MTKAKHDKKKSAPKKNKRVRAAGNSAFSSDYDYKKDYDPSGGGGPNLKNLNVGDIAEGATHRALSAISDVLLRMGHEGIANIRNKKKKQQASSAAPPGGPDDSGGAARGRTKKHKKKK